MNQCYPAMHLRRWPIIKTALLQCIVFAWETQCHWIRYTVMTVRIGFRWHYQLLGYTKIKKINHEKSLTNFLHVYTCVRFSTQLCFFYFLFVFMHNIILEEMRCRWEPNSGSILDQQYWISISCFQDGIDIISWLYNQIIGGTLLVVINCLHINQARLLIAAAAVSVAHPTHFLATRLILSGKLPTNNIISAIF